VAQNEKHFSVALTESKKISPICKKTLLEAFKLIKIDISNSYLDYLMNKMLSEAKALRDIEPKHFFLVLKRKEQENNADEEIFDENLASSEQNQFVQSDNFVVSQNVENKDKKPQIE
jgi:hypothetical protein